MCGIVGVIDQRVGRRARQLLDQLLETMQSRGPDGQGHFVDGKVLMGMKRLAVIDVEGGNQPLTNGAGTVVAFQNGEIYNHAQLRRELELEERPFRTHSDTEVLAHGYEQWGIEGLLQRVDGMYAIALLDRTNQELHLARDRFGEKPLYYSMSGERFAYSSNMTALALLDWVDIGIDIRSVDHYLALHYVPGRRTMLKGIHRLLPGERLRMCLKAMKVQVSRYYSLPLTPLADVDTASLREQLESAVVSRLVADVPVGVFLSGGIDSSLIATLAAKHHPGINTFSMGFEDTRCDESLHAKTVARHIGSTHHHFTFNERSFLELLPAVIESLDDPIGDQALLPTYWLCREARKHVTVVLSGEGADELFGGYDYYRRSLDRRRWNERLLGWVRGTPPQGGETSLSRNAAPVTPSGFPLVLDAATRQSLIGPVNKDGEDWCQNLFETLALTGDSIQRATVADLLTWLPDDLLVKLDRMAMAHSLEGRAPFLAPALAEIAVRLPSHRKVVAGQGKVALRVVAESLLPPGIAGRAKQGFVLPMAQWVGQWFRQAGDLRRYLDLSRISECDTDALQRLLQQEITNGCRNERFLFAMIVLVEWHRSFFARIGARQEIVSCV